MSKLVEQYHLKEYNEDYIITLELCRKIERTNKMPRMDFIEKTIFDIEEVKVDFLKNGKNVRGDDSSIHTNYSAKRKTKNVATVAKFKERLKKQFPGYDFLVYRGDGEVADGHMHMGNLRDTYISDDED